MGGAVQLFHFDLAKAILHRLRRSEIIERTIGLCPGALTWHWSCIRRSRRGATYPWPGAVPAPAYQVQEGNVWA